MQQKLNFIPPGPVATGFMNCRLPVKFIMGPVGSGKTSCMMVDTIYNAARQMPSKAAFEYVGGAKLYIRYSKALFVRETFRQLYGTTIPSWWQWMPKDAGEWKGGGNEPGQHKLRWHLPSDGVHDETIVDLQVVFEALGEQNVEALFRGKEFNLLRLNEADTLAPEVLSQGVVRVSQGRYPGEKHVSPKDCVSGVSGDYNAPDIENYLYHLREEKRPTGWGFFRQPGGLDAKAENRERATREAYEQMERDLFTQGREDLARRMIHNQYGFTRDGKPVYPEYRDDFHCVDGLQPVKGIVVRVDFDQGLHPAATLRQTMPNGQRRILDELYSDGGATGLCEALKQLAGSSRYAGVKIVGGRCDPAANARDGNDAESWVDCINRLMGWTGHQRVRIADTNAPDKRQAAVRYFLTKTLENGQPALIISSTCRVARKGFNSEYRFKKKRRGSGAGYDDAPEKKFPAADVHDSIQYGALDDGGYEEVVGRQARAQGRMGSGRMFQAKMEVRL